MIRNTLFGDTVPTAHTRETECALITADLLVFGFFSHLK